VIRYASALLATLGLASAAQAGVYIDFSPNGPYYVAEFSPSSSITVNIHLTVTGAEIVSGYQFSLVYDPALVGGFNTLVNAPTHAGSGSWVSGGAGLALDGGDGGIGAAISASTLTAGDEITAADGTILIGSVRLHVDTFSAYALVLSGCFNCDPFGPTGDIVIGAISQGAPNLSGSVFFQPLLFPPEPTTASLLGLGLLGLGAAARRRRPTRGG